MHIDQQRFFSSAFDEIGELMREDLVKEALLGVSPGAGAKAAKFVRGIFQRGGGAAKAAKPPPVPSGAGVVPPAPPPPVPAAAAAAKAPVSPLAPGPRGQLVGPAAPTPTIPTAAHPGAAGRVAAKPPPAAAPATQAAAPAAGGAPAAVAATPSEIAAAEQLSQSSLAKGVRGWRAMGLGGGAEHMGKLYQAGGVRGVLGSHMGRVAAGTGAAAVAVPTAAAYGAGRLGGQRY